MTAHPRKILIVDDDAGQRSLLDSFLRSQGFKTHVVISGEAALTALRNESFAMMISCPRHYQRGDPEFRTGPARAKPGCTGTVIRAAEGEKK